MILSDKHIKERLALSAEHYQRIVVEPLGKVAVRECSIDVRLHPKIMQPKNTGLPVSTLDPNVEYITTEYGPKKALTIYPGCFVLGSTVERIEVPKDLKVDLTGKSSLARLGLVIHLTAGHVEPGFKGQLTLEIKNFGPSALMLYPNQFIGQLIFHLLTSVCEEDYSVKGRYMNQEGPVASKGVGHE